MDKSMDINIHDNPDNMGNTLCCRFAINSAIFQMFVSEENFVTVDCVVSPCVRSATVTAHA